MCYVCYTTLAAVMAILPSVRCHGYPANGSFSWLSCHRFAVMAILPSVRCHGYPAIGSLSWLSCHRFAVMAILPSVQGASETKPKPFHINTMYLYVFNNSQEMYKSFVFTHTFLSNLHKTNILCNVNNLLLNDLKYYILHVFYTKTNF